MSNKIYLFICYLCIDTRQIYCLTVRHRGREIERQNERDRDSKEFFRDIYYAIYYGKGGGVGMVIWGKIQIRGKK